MRAYACVCVCVCVCACLCVCVCVCLWCVVVYLRSCHHHQDEWICIALLFAITQQFPDTIVQLHDSDGEVLLIEAALDLPKWLEPDTSDDRIFVANGKLQVALACSSGVSVVEIISIVFAILAHKRTHSSTHTHTQMCVHSKLFRCHSKRRAARKTLDYIQKALFSVNKALISVKRYH